MPYGHFRVPRAVGRLIALPAGLALVAAISCGTGNTSYNGRFEGAGGQNGYPFDGSMGGRTSTGGGAGFGGVPNTDGGAGFGGMPSRDGGADAGGQGGGGGGGGGSGGVCNDPDEPDNTPSTAKQACSPSPCSVNDPDGDGSDTKGPIKGVIQDNDVDWWTFLGNDTVWGVAQADASTTDTGYRLCVFVACTGGRATTLNSCTAGIQASGPDGMVGCCSTNGEASPDHTCAGGGIGGDDSAQVYIRIDGATACEPYTINWHF